MQHSKGTRRALEWHLSSRALKALRHSRHSGTRPLEKHLGTQVLGNFGTRGTRGTRGTLFWRLRHQRRNSVGFICIFRMKMQMSVLEIILFQYLLEKLFYLPINFNFFLFSVSMMFCIFKSLNYDR